MRRSGRVLISSLSSLGLLTAALAGPAAAGEQLTKKEFRQEANDLCRAANRALGAVFGEAFAGLPDDQEPPAAVYETAVAAALPIFREVLDAVEDLEGPASFEKKVDKVLDQYRAVADDIEEDPAVAFGDDEEEIWAKADKAAKKVGIGECTQGEE